MNGIGRYWLVKMLLDALMTVVFLAFAWVFREVDKTLASMVLGITLSHWFTSSTKAGQTLSSPPGYSTVSVKGEQPPAPETQ